MKPEIGQLSPPFVGDILAQHLEEFAFLHVQRRHLLFSPEVSLEGFLQHDERIVAHWDGLVIGGIASAGIARKNLEEFDPWDVYAALVTWLQLEQPSPDIILEIMAKAPEDMYASWREALRRIPGSVLEKLIPIPLVESPSPFVKASLLYARGWHGSLTLPDLPALVEDEDGLVRYGLARSLGWVNDPDRTAALKLLEPLHQDRDEAICRAATWSSLLLGDEKTLTELRAKIQSGEADAFQLRSLGYLGQVSDLNLLLPYLDTPLLASAAALALAYLGNIQASPLLIKLLDEDNSPELAEAGEVALEILLGEIAMDEDDPALPPAEFFTQWWDKNRAKLDKDQRWLAGKPWPWAAESQEAPMASLWLSSLRTEQPQLRWLKLEIPDGFLGASVEPETIGLKDLEALPGD